MTKREKVIEAGMTREEIITGLELIAEQYKYIVSDVAKGAIALLKAQEPVKPIRMNHNVDKYIDHYKCPICDNLLAYENQYCSECGRPLNWIHLDVHRQVPDPLSR